VACRLPRLQQVPAFYIFEQGEGKEMKRIGAAFKHGKKAATLADAESIKTTFYYLSQFGFRFVEACKFPQSAPAKHAARKP